MHSNNEKAHRANGGQRDAIGGLTRRDGIRRRRSAESKTTVERDESTARAVASMNLHRQAEPWFPRLTPYQCAVLAALINDQALTPGRPFNAPCRRIAKRLDLDSMVVSRVLKRLVELGAVVVVKRGSIHRANVVLVVDPLPPRPDPSQIDPNARTVHAKSREELPDEQVLGFVDAYVDGNTHKRATIDRALVNGIPRRQATDLMNAALARKFVRIEPRGLPPLPVTCDESQPIRRAVAHVLIREARS